MKKIDSFKHFNKKNSVNELTNAINLFLNQINKRDEWLSLKKKCINHIQDNFSNKNMLNNFNIIRFKLFVSLLFFFFLDIIFYK